MITKPASLWNVLLAVSVVFIFAGCSTAGKKPLGAHARAEKGMTTPTGGDDGGAVDWTPNPTLSTEPIPLNQYFADQGITNLCTRVHFDYDKSDIKDEFKDCLNQIAAALQQFPEVEVLVEGHTDERGTNEYNLALGERRASSTVHYLVNLGVNASRFTTRSLGEEQPLELCSNESCWKVNRRADFYVIRKP